MGDDGDDRGRRAGATRLLAPTRRGVFQDAGGIIVAAPSLQCRVIQRKPRGERMRLGPWRMSRMRTMTLRGGSAKVSFCQAERLKAAALSMAQLASVRAGMPVTSATVDVTKAG